MSADDHKPIPLTEWIVGTLALHFPGATVKRRMTLREAQDIQKILDDKRSGDRLDWHHLAWTGFDETKVLATEFDSDEDLGWSLSTEDRATLANNGHPHGILRTLHDHWLDKGPEPSYSLAALGHLYRAALDGTAGEEFIKFADKVEGEAGARVLRKALDWVKQQRDAKTGQSAPSSADLNVDDAAEGEEAPDDSEPTASEQDSTEDQIPDAE